MKSFSFSILLLVLITLLSACRNTPTTATATTPEEISLIPADGKLGLRAKHGMVVTAHPIASQVGVDILKKGGNAWDAAIAVNYALAVVYPGAGNIGGGGFLVYRSADGKSGTLDYREKAPKAAHRDMYLDNQGNAVAQRSREGHLAVGVPGTVAGMQEIFQSFASLPMTDLLQPAIDLARQGFPLTELEAEKLNRYKQHFIRANRFTPSVVQSTAWQAGDSIRYEQLGDVLSRIRDEGQAGFYAGKTADLIVAEMKAGGGLITHDDLASYEAIWRDPLLGNYRGYQIISMPPPSSGGIALVQLLKGSEAYDVGEMGHNTAENIQLMVELERRVYADRATHLGDMDFYPVPVAELISDSYILDRMKDISLSKKTSSQAIKAGKVERIESFETTHFSIVDEAGNAVSITTTLNGTFGSKVMVEGGGFFLNNEMDDFSAKPGVPNMFGLVGGEANAIEPGKRMLSSMTPTIVEKDNELYMVVGTPGGSTIITSVFQTILNVIDHGMSMQEAVDAKKIHSQWLPDRVYGETGAISIADSMTLAKMGHEVVIGRTLGRMACILVTEDGMLEGGADPRADNASAGY